MVVPVPASAEQEELCERVRVRAGRGGARQTVGSSVCAQGEGARTPHAHTPVGGNADDGCVGEVVDDCCDALPDVCLIRASRGRERRGGEGGGREGRGGKSAHAARQVREGDGLGTGQWEGCRVRVHWRRTIESCLHPPLVFATPSRGRLVHNTDNHVKMRGHWEHYAEVEHGREDQRSPMRSYCILSERMTSQRSPIALTEF